MKKTTIILILTVILQMNNIVLSQERQEEYNPFPIDNIERYDIDTFLFELLSDSESTYGYDERGSWPRSVDMQQQSIIAYLFTTDCAMVIYGMAFSTYPMKYEFMKVNALDTSIENWQEYTCLYKPIGDSMFLLDKSQFSQFAAPNYVLPPHLGCTENPHAMPQYLYSDSIKITPPLFEIYYDTAKYITDSFYMGSTRYNNVYPYRYSPQSTGLQHKFTTIQPYGTISVETQARLYARLKAYDNGRWKVDSNFSIPIVFPIMSPEPGRSTPTPVDTVLNYFDTTQVDTTQVDTTQVDTTHSGISAGMLERYINVYPALADGGTVTVLSSFHLEGVEVYDAAGRMLSRQPASGVATTVDVSQLPAGSYVLRVNTVSGSTTKKLVLR